MKFVSLFSGIGGIDLGLERAGMECVAQIENEPWCTRILEKHWPTIPRWQDIHDLDPKELPDHDLIAGGFPCQPISLAGGRRAQKDDRWLWPEFFRIVRLVRPRYVLVENVPGLASAGMGDVLGDLATVGYDAEWQSIPAVAVGAPHLRWRIFIVAYPERVGRIGGADDSRGCNPDRQDVVSGRRKQVASGSGSSSQKLADADSGGRDGRSRIFGSRGWRQPTDGGPAMADTNRIDGGQNDRRTGQSRHGRGVSYDRSLDDWWAVEPDVGRVADGVPRRVDRLRGLGNAVVPQIAELVGRMIMEADRVA